MTDEWQPIETSPKDGYFLVCDMSGHPEDYTATVEVVWWDSDILVVAITYEGRFIPCATNPTHWMPLPSPPKENT